jgi:hypothetical protein
MRHLLFFTFLLAAVISNSQPPTAREWRKLSDRIFYRLAKNDSMDTEDHKAEYILCVFKVDSLGKIASVHYLTDPQNTGSLFKAIACIPLSEFNGWVYDKAKGRTIVLPVVYCPEGGCPEYINDLVNSRGDKSLYLKILNENSTTIWLTALPGGKPITKY